MKPHHLDSEVNSHWLYSIRLAGITKLKRDMLIDALETMAIQCRPFFEPLSIMPPFVKYKIPNYNYQTNAISDIGICLPSYPNMKNSDIDIIAENVIYSLDIL